MALTIQVTKISVQQAMPKMWEIILNLTCLDTAVEVINQDFTERYRTGQALSDIGNRFLAAMQDAIDIYKAEQVIFTNPQMDTVVTALNNQLVG